MVNGRHEAARDDGDGDGDEPLDDRDEELEELRDDPPPDEYEPPMPGRASATAPQNSAIPNPAAATRVFQAQNRSMRDHTRVGGALQAPRRSTAPRDARRNLRLRG